jgi:hypothetical protein
VQEIGDWFEHVLTVGFSGSLNEHPAIPDQASSRNRIDAMWPAITMQNATSIQNGQSLAIFAIISMKFLPFGRQEYRLDGSKISVPRRRPQLKTGGMQKTWGEMQGQKMGKR